MRSKPTLALAALCLTLGGGTAHATTLSSSTWDTICRVTATVGNDADPAKNFVILSGTVIRGGVTILLTRNQGARVCYQRSTEPHDCASPMQDWVCAPVSDSLQETLDIR